MLVGLSKRRFLVATLTFGMLLPAFVALLLADTLGPRTQAGSEAAEDDALGISSALPAVTAPPAAALHSRWVSQSPLRVISLGATATISLSFRNIGSTPWIRGTAAEARLGVAHDDRRFFEMGFARDWPEPDRPAVQSESVVAPGSIATFGFQVHGAVTGVHRIPLRPLVEGVTWMEDEGAYVEFWVR